MTSRVRFTTARQVFEAFPVARDDIAAAPTDEPPLAYLRSLGGSPTPEDAISFCAYILPRREAVWWACQCVRTLAPLRDGDEAALQAAEAWVREPDEAHRRAAMDAGDGADRRSPATWALLAAAWSGGSMSTEHNVPCPPHLTAKAARAAVLVALAQVEVKERAGRLKACLDEGVRLAGSDGSGR